MTIIEVLERNSKKFSMKEAIIEISYSKEGIRRVLSWREFNGEANQIANFLQFKGVKKGDKIAIVMKNCIEWLPVFFGILKSGAVAVPVNHYMTNQDIKHSIVLSKCVGIIFSNEISEKLKNIISEVPFLACVSVGKVNCWSSCEYDTIISNYSTDFKRIEMDDTDDATIHFSSGTTGLPKAVLHNHNALVYSAIIESFHRNVDSEDSILCVSPLFHAGIKMHWFGVFLHGGKIIILNEKSPQTILKSISYEKLTMTWLPVSIVQNILDMKLSRDIDLSNYDLSSWRINHMGAQPIAPSLVLAWQKCFPKIDFDISYGLTEASGPGCVVLGSENISKRGSIGKAGLFWKAKIVDSNFNEVSDSVVGELVVKGPGIMKEYFNDLKATNDKIKNGWLFTGDMGYKDGDGFIYLVSRKDDMIISGGINVYPIHIENFIKKYPGVKDVAVVGVADKYYGEIIVAVIESINKNCTSNEIKLFCNELPFYERPRKIVFSCIPRNHLDKIDKKQLKKLLKENEYCGL